MKYTYQSEGIKIAGQKLKLKDLSEQVNSMIAASAPARLDAIVIGVGSMGASACYHLARRGYRVLGIEQFDIPHNNGSHAGQSRLIRKAYGEGSAYVPLLQRAYENWETLENEVGAPVFFRTGLVYFGSRDNTFFESVRSSAKTYAIPLHDYDHKTSSHRFPQFSLPDQFQCLVEPDAGFLSPERSILFHVREALRHGASIRTGERVTGWSSNTGGVTVTTSHGEYRAAKLIITAGPWAGKMIPELSDQLNVTRQVLAWVKPKRPDAFQLGNFPCWYMEENGFDFYGFPILPQEEFGAPYGLKVALHYPGDRVPDPDNIDRSIQPCEEQKLIEFLQRYLPDAFETTQILKTCLYTYSPDSDFIIDLPDAYNGNVAIAAGFSGHGFKFASVIGEVLADLAMEGSTTMPIDFLHPRRFGK